MIKRLFIVFSLIFCSTVANSQDSLMAFGLRAGWNLSRVTNFDDKIKSGFHIGTYYKIPIEDNLWLQPELTYSQKGSSSGLKDQKIFYSPFDDAFYRRRKLTLHYIDLLIPVRYDITDGFHVLAGPGASFLVNSLYKYNNGDDGNDRYEEVNGRRFDFILQAGLGYEFKNGLLLGVRGEKGFVSVLDNYENTKNYTIQLTAGFTIAGPRRNRRTFTEGQFEEAEYEEIGYYREP